MKAITEARLDERSARSIAAGRLNAIRERVLSVKLSTLPHKRGAATRQCLVHMHTLFGNWVLGEIIIKNRFACVVVADPHPVLNGWIDVYFIQVDLKKRERDVDFRVLFSISAHATARLLERRRDVDIERLIAEELADIAVLRAVMDNYNNNANSEFVLQTVNGEFRGYRDHGKLIAATWIGRKPN
jgi:hypothetical protein